MQIQLDIEFEQLIKLAKQLPATQWTKLKTEVEKAKKQTDTITSLEDFLLNAPTFSKDQLMKLLKQEKL